MKQSLRGLGGALMVGAVATCLSGGLATAQAQETKKPNILFIMGDDIGWMQTSYYHRGLMVGETPNLDRIGREGLAFTDYYAGPAAPPAAMRSSRA